MVSSIENGIYYCDSWGRISLFKAFPFISNVIFHVSEKLNPYDALLVLEKLFFIQGHVI